MLDFAKDRKFWDFVRDSDDFARHRKLIKDKYDWAFEKEPQTMTYATYFGKGKQGDIFFRRLFQIQASALMSMMYYDNEEYFCNLVETIWAYCNEYTWAPMGHYNKYYNCTPGDYDPGLIDIYAASIAFTLAEIKHVMQNRLPQLLKDRISAEIRRRTVEPYITRKFFWEKHDNNWAAVCAGAVGGVLMYEAPDEFVRQKDRLRSTMQCYLDSYADDGVCVEGTAYWGFGFGFFAIYASLLYEFTNGKDDLFKIPKVRAIACFVQKTFIDSQMMISFSDCNPREKYWIGLPHMLRSIYGDEIAKLPEEAGTVIEYQHFAFSFRSIICFKKEYVAKEKLLPETYNMDKTGWFVRRGKNYGLAIKGGNNGESHNHNDVGSFILSKDNKQIFADIGAGPYCEGYHTDRRYTFLHPSSWSHNVPYFGDKPQDGVRRGGNVIIDYDVSRNTATCEFSRMYGLDYVRMIRRTFIFKEKSLALIDIFETDHDTPITERFVSFIKPDVEGNSIIISGVRLTPKKDMAPQIILEKAKDHALKDVDIYFIDYSFHGKEQVFEAIIEITD